MIASSLLSLPVELHDTITEHLTIFDQHALRGTCQYFRSLLPPFITLDAPVTLEKLYEAANTWDHTRFKLQMHEAIKPRYVCAYCMRLLPRSRFGDEAFCLHTRNLFCIRCGVLPMSHNPYHLLGSDPPGQSDQRRLRKKRMRTFVAYKPGARITIESVPYIICAECRKLQSCSTSHRGSVCDQCCDRR